MHLLNVSHSAHRTHGMRPSFPWLVSFLSIPALVVLEDVWRKHAGEPVVGEAGEAKAQCALSTLRNLLRDEEPPAKLLVDSQCRGGVG